MNIKKKGRPNNIDFFIGNNLKKARLVNGLSQEDLASASGVSFQQIQKYENAINRVSASMMYKLSSALKVDPMFFYNGLDIPQDSFQELISLDAETAQAIRLFKSISDKEVKKSLLAMLKTMVAEEN